MFYGAQAEVFAANLDFFFTKVRELVYPAEDVKLHRPTVQDLPHSLQWIEESLKISDRILPRFEGDLHVIFDKYYERMFPIDKPIFADIVKGKFSSSPISPLTVTCSSCLTASLAEWLAP